MWGGKMKQGILVGLFLLGGIFFYVSQEQNEENLNSEIAIEEEYTGQVFAEETSEISEASGNQEKENAKPIIVDENVNANVVRTREPASVASNARKITKKQKKEIAENVDKQFQERLQFLKNKFAYNDDEAMEFIDYLIDMHNRTSEAKNKDQNLFDALLAERENRLIQSLGEEGYEVYMQYEYALGEKTFKQFQASGIQEDQMKDAIKEYDRILAENSFN